MNINNINSKISRFQFNLKLFLKSQYNLVPSFLEKPIANQWEKKVVMIHSGRCGSSVLGDILGQNPSIFWAGEIYTELFYNYLKKSEIITSKNVFYDVNDFKKSLIMYCYVDRLLNSKEKSIYGFEVNTAKVSELYFEYLEKTIGVSYFCILTRKNHLRQIISYEIAKMKSKYHIKSQKHQSLSKLKLNINSVLPNIINLKQSLVERIKHFDDSVSKCEELLLNKGLSFLKLTYEDHIENDPNIANQLVSDFLGVKFHEGRINFVRTNPYKIQNILSNYEEVEENLKGTKYEWMLYG